jgi:hypothetical protein
VESEFIYDGIDRADSAAEPRVRAQVEAEYAQRLAAAGPWGRYWLRRAITREIRRRVRQLAPELGLY